MTSWQRPDTTPYPQVWHTFQSLDSYTNNLVRYRVQDLPPDRFEDAVEHMRKYFLRDEPICASLRLAEDPVGMREICDVWRRVVQQRCAVVCFQEGSDEIVGLNMLTVVSREYQAQQQQQFASPAVRAFVECTLYMTEKGQLFEHFSVDHFLSAWGLSVHPAYRSRGLATEILRARVPLCKAFGIRLSATVFSHPGSQHPAAKVGFMDRVVERFDELTKKGFQLGQIPVEFNKLMTLSVDLHPKFGVEIIVLSKFIEGSVPKSIE